MNVKYNELLNKIGTYQPLNREELKEYITRLFHETTKSFMTSTDVKDINCTFEQMSEDHRKAFYEKADEILIRFKVSSIVYDKEL